MGLQRVGHDWETELNWATFTLYFLDSIFKSRDITLPTKVHLVKAMVFPVVMYGCESWTVKKAESQRIAAFFFLIFYFFQLLLLNCGVGEDS